MASTLQTANDAPRNFETKPRNEIHITLGCLISDNLINQQRPKRLESRNLTTLPFVLSNQGKLVVHFSYLESDCHFICDSFLITMIETIEAKVEHNSPSCAHTACITAIPIGRRHQAAPEHCTCK
jgi:hypothetical protein